eukprot:CAMPEP_0114609456 /NCGR_PEP_ID=MMETSP0168-20121206/3098_1 /TAXON_ID=95228 ORGANISM="Vannella sp., Strain DIVA3 517/6/12" /NCGR_SAMPLE_ID=MMETSP0168 /ASSEMBLY_ACC=CAM_ASM_000044 /LENGTH=325 /DNA_ID=CAMNT_0001820375 /DNA_START=79 /DNA_END=1057 /DNA_ORIENTATION=-
MGFNNPYFLNYVSTTFLLGCHVVQLSLYAYRRSKHHLPTSDGWLQGFLQFMRDATRIPIVRLVVYALPLTVLWFCANYFFAIALSMTNIASSMSLEQSTTIFVFILSVPLLGEKVTILKLLGVGICIMGVVYIAIGDQLADDKASFAEGSALLGDALVIASAISAATYMTVYTKLLRNLPLAIPAVNALLGCIGIWNTLLFWPGLIILSVLGYEDYSMLSWEIAAVIVISALAAFAFNYFLNYGMILTSPLVMRVVIVLGVPCSFVVNAFLYGLGVFGWSSVMRITGGALIIAGFALFTLNATIEQHDEDFYETEDEDDDEPVIE